MRFLLDTNIISDSRKVGTVASDWIQTQHPYDIGISAITLYELEHGIRLIEHRDRRQGIVLRTWLDGSVMPTFDSSILPVNDAVAREAARLQVLEPMSDPDALIAATALCHNLTLVTRNIDDFSRTGARILNPWIRS